MTTNGVKEHICTRKCLRVGDLRRALEGVNDDLLVTMRASAVGDSGDVDVCCGLRSAEVEDNCGGLHFALDGDTYLDYPTPEEEEERAGWHGCDVDAKEGAAPDDGATWFVDPPYQGSVGRRYRYSDVDFGRLASIGASAQDAAKDAAE